MEQTPAPSNSPLQFDKADFSGSSSKPECQVCKNEIADSYFEVNGKFFCPSCKEKLNKALTGGSPAKRVILATVAGSGAALLGAGIYYAIEKISGYEFGLIAIFVGLMVGGAVRWGSERRGGWLYQALAMFLTYNAIVLTYLPFIFKEFDNKEKKPVPAQTTSTVVPATTSVPSAGVPTPATPIGTPAEAALPTPQATVPFQTASSAPPPDLKDMTVGKFILGVCAIFFIAYIAPFLAGFKNIIGLVIIGFALYEAWKMNAKPKILINGPFQVGQPKP